ncbi:MAG: AraC family transcriptional regulator [Chitinophagia bacterium]|nr:AraC family transcriptional regulator [Chitinophagia bacterium]
MPAKSLLNPLALAQPAELKTLVENRRIYNLNSCELNIFESYEQAYRVPLTFTDLVVTSMVRGKKVMHLFNKPSFDYLPGETVILPANETMVIDFPEAAAQSPSQCIALTVDAQYAHNTINFMNEYYNSLKDELHEWKLQFNKYHFDNDTEITQLINKLIRVCCSTEKAKNIFADLNLKELLIRLLQSQHLEQIKTNASLNNNRGRLEFVLHYINQNLTGRILINDLCRKALLSRNAFFAWFREQFGTTPVEYINSERLKLAKQLLADRRYNVAEVSYRCGFNDINYFVRLFRMKEGITPGSYKMLVHQQQPTIAGA